MEEDDNQQRKLSLNLFTELIKNNLRLGAMVWKEKRTEFIVLWIAVIIGASIPFLTSGSRGLLINELINITGTGVFNSYLILVIAVTILTLVVPSFLWTIQRYFGKLFWFYLEEKFELLVLRKKAEIDVAIHEDPKQKDLLNRIAEHGTYRAREFVDRQFYIFQGALEVILASVILISAKWWLFLIILIGTVPGLIKEISYGRSVWGIHSAKAEVRRRYWDLHSYFNRLPSLIELKLFQNVGHFLGIITKLFKNFQNAEKENEKRQLWVELGTSLVSQTTLAFAALWFIYEVVQGNLQIGTFVFFLASMGELRQSLSGLFYNLGRQYQDSLFISDLFTLIDMKPTIISPQRAIILKNQSPKIIFDNVSFAYPGTKKAVLKDFSLEIDPGDKLALVGINGAGKTTFVKLLCRFYDPTKGRILVDGHDLKDIELESWYGQLGILFQDYSQYHFLVREAIAVGKTNVPESIERIKKAAQSSEANAFIEEWEAQYDQMLGPEFTTGVEPSIGQWQKLALARTFYRDPQILVLDEPTSSIDAEAEAKIFEKLEQLPKDRTVILISHRFSTVRKANKIAVIEGGKLTELGSHEKLLKKKGTYARLFNIQAKDYR